MKQNNELLEYIYKTASMGYESTTNLLRALENKDNKLKKAIEDELRRNYIISDSKVHSIAQKKNGKNLPVDSRKLTKYEVIEIETYRFLNKYGYDIELKNDEPKYQDTMASEILRIVEYINSSKIF